MDYSPIPPQWSLYLGPSYVHQLGHTQKALLRMWNLQSSFWRKFCLTFVAYERTNWNRKEVYVKGVKMPVTSSLLEGTLMQRCTRLKLACKRSESFQLHRTDAFSVQGKPPFLFEVDRLPLLKANLYATFFSRKWQRKKTAIFLLSTTSEGDTSMRHFNIIKEPHFYVQKSRELGNDEDI